MTTSQLLTVGDCLADGDADGRLLESGWRAVPVASFGRQADTTAPLGEFSSLDELFANAGAVAVCDCDPDLAAHAGLRTAIGRAARSVPVVWRPSRHEPDPVDGATMAVVSVREAAAIAGQEISGDWLRSAVAGGRALHGRWPVRYVAVTVDNGGVVLVEGRQSNPLVLPRRDGAGWAADGHARLVVALALQLGSGRTAVQALEAVADSVAGPRDAEIELDALVIAERVRAEGGRIVAAGGCFDLLHAGHLSLLRSARSLGDCLIVCMNSDASVGRLKGPARPVMPESERAEMLRALSCVDGVLMFEEDTPDCAIAKLRPDVWIKGGDYQGRRVGETDLVESLGGQVILLPQLAGRSTTALIDKVKRT